jgi:integrase
LNIAHNYSPVDGLKLPKNNRKRIVPLLPEVRIALLDLLKDNPHETDDPFVFYSLLPDRPVVPGVIWEGLRKAIEKANGTAKKTNEKFPEVMIDYKSRNICFHSWRHFFCSKITERIEGEKVAKVSGHLSESVFKKYADHIEAKNIQDVGNAAAQAFENVLQFRKGA